MVENAVPVQGGGNGSHSWSIGDGVHPFTNPIAGIRYKLRLVFKGSSAGIAFVLQIKPLNSAPWKGLHSTGDEEFWFVNKVRDGEVEAYSDEGIVASDFGLTQAELENAGTLTVYSGSNVNGMPILAASGQQQSGDANAELVRVDNLGQTQLLQAFEQPLYRAQKQWEAAQRVGPQARQKAQAEVQQAERGLAFMRGDVDNRFRALARTGGQSDDTFTDNITNQILASVGDSRIGAGAMGLFRRPGSGAGLSSPVRSGTGS